MSHFEPTKWGTDDPVGLVSLMHFTYLGQIDQMVWLINSEDSSSIQEQQKERAAANGETNFNTQLLSNGLSCLTG